MLNLSKKWCNIYVVVSSIIIIQSIIFELTNINGFNTSILTIYNIIFSTILLTLVWFFIKSTLGNKEKLEDDVNELKRFKNNFNFFQFLSKSIEEYEGFEELKGITFGKPTASTQLTLILNPNCNDSQKAFIEAYELYQGYSEKIYLKLLFNSNPSNTKNPHKSVVENLLALNAQNPENAKKAIIDWYINQYNLKNWSRKWNSEAPNLLINKQLQDQYFWCLKNGFDHTPVKIINENLFPEEYQISELKYFINDFQEEYKYEQSLKVV